ncbi:M23 family metallopeptidase [Embleya scabrispora]|uniref:M23 family metallopeptidase n=1 Tax=Embleya scabrispora TaxID=159449 RepID=UPI00131A280D|nr:M23 family metallopeptidase [Embleya scabrispora]MYS81273.1 peptidoglycan DD-metalloendopeptidase family protein [Streptomyces sp. SID5474]
MPHSPEAPTTSTSTSADRLSRLKALRPSRPATAVAGLALLAVAVTTGVQAAGTDTSRVRATGAPSADPDIAQRLAGRGADVAARSQERPALDTAQAAERQAAADTAARVEAERVEAEQAREAERVEAERAEAERAREAEEQAEAERAAAERAASGWVVPTSGYTLTGRFGNSGSRWAHTHTGLDFATRSGTPIKAAAAGKIASAGTAGAFGNRIVITHPDGTQTWYCHQSRFAKTSGSVAAGEVIGYVGTTGNSTGPHLHFEVHPKGGAAVDPNKWLAGKGVAP